MPHVVIGGDLAAYNRYRCEMDIAAWLDHPGLQRLISDIHSSFMVFEYSEGKSLRAYLKAHAPFRIEHALRIGVGLASPTHAPTEQPFPAGVFMLKLEDMCHAAGPTLDVVSI